MNMNTLIGAALAPLAAALLAWAVSPARRWVERKFPEGKLKRLMLKKVN